MNLIAKSRARAAPVGLSFLSLHHTIRAFRASACPDPSESKVPTMSYVSEFLEEAKRICDSIDAKTVEGMVDIIDGVRAGGGRLFFLGVGGGAGHAGHAVNDFRKIAGIESYAPTDNVSELTARTNDDGWEPCYANWLRTSRLNAKDTLFVFSVGGGNVE